MSTMKQLAFLLPLIALGGCDFADCVTANGESVERTIDLPVITGVETQGSIDVTITQGNEQRIVVRGPKEIVDMIRSEVKNGVWSIGTEHCYNTNKAITVEITMADLQKAAVAGSGSITGKSLFEPEQIDIEVAGSGDIALEVNAKSVDVDIAGSGSITLRGTTADVQVDIAGSGDVHGFDLSAANGDVDIAGSGNVELTVIEKLDAEIAGSGDVRYKGRPQVKSDVAGSGSVSGVE